MAGNSASAHEAATEFHDLHTYMSLRRTSGLALSPDGTRLVASVQERSHDGKRFVSALWEIDPSGQREPVRLTRSEAGESAPAFLPDGTLLFSSARPLPAEEHDTDKDRPALWALPPRGEPRPLLRRADLGGFVTAPGSRRIAFDASVLPTADDADDDAKRRKARRDAGVSAVLYESGDVRIWDHDAGPGVPHVFTSDVASDAASAHAIEHIERAADTAADTAAEARERGAADRAGDAAVDCGSRRYETDGLALSWDGALLAYAVVDGHKPQQRHETLRVADAATGHVRRVIGEPGYELGSPAFTPDGRGLVFVRITQGTYAETQNLTLWYVPLDEDADRPEGWELAPSFEQWPHGPVFSPRGSHDEGWTLFFTADEAGHAPLFRLTLQPTRPDADTSPVRLTRSGAYTAPVVAPDGSAVYALRAAIDAAAAPVRVDPDGSDAEPVALPDPAPIGALPGTLTEVTARAADGTPLRAWLALPADTSAANPAPLFVNVHGGPQMSHNTWSWRWNAWPFVARGYAVLLPDPALSTGYGQDFHRRAWHDESAVPYGDIMALTDATLTRDDVDAERTSLGGGSYGGQMANWVAGHTDRFRCIVTHASLWNLFTFAGTTDYPNYWTTQYGDPITQPERYQRASPHLAADDVTTPMLIVHGARDYRVPIGEAHALWYELRRRGLPARFLYFPDENHWVLKPNNSELWFSTVLAFLDEHVLGKPFDRPALV